MNRPRSNVNGCMSVLSEDMSYEKMEEDLTCPVCLELYADPLMMPCSHSMCKACLHDIMKSRERSGKQDLECPACREKHHLSMEQVNLLPKNLALENIVFRYQEIRSCSLSRAAQLGSPPPTSSWLQSGSSHSPVPSPSHDDSGREQDLVFDDSVEEKLSCGMCEEMERSEAEWFCPQCQVLYCQVCLDTFHPRRGSLVKHKVRRPTGLECPGSLLFCHEHCSEIASIFCDTCKVVACHLCVCLGQGSHCAHTILDMETARRQLQESVEMAQDKLSALVASFSEKESNIGTQLQNLKVMEDCARSSVTSQYNCIMSDVAAILNLAKRKSLDTISELSSQHSSYLLTRSENVKALLSRCEDLSQACQGFLSTGDNDDHSENQAVNLSFGSSKDCSGNEKTVSGSLVLDGNTLSDGHPRDGSASSESTKSKGFGSRRPTADDSACSTTSPRLGSVSERAEVGEGACGTDAADGGTHTKRNSSQHRKSLSELEKLSNQRPKARSQSESKSQKQTSLPEPESCFANPKHSRHTDRECRLEDDTSQSRSSSTSGATDQSITSDLALAQAEPLDVSVARKLATDKKNSAKKLYGSQSVEERVCTPRSDADYSPSPSGRTQSTSACGDRERLVDILPQGLGATAQTHHGQLLLRADEVGPVLEQVSALSKQISLEHSNTDESMEANSKDHDEKISSCISSFHTSTLHLIHNMTAQISDDCPIVTPCVRSVSVASPHQESRISRVQSRILMTWGFNSTTFTADAITAMAQWSVNINRNTSHIGDVKSGYLFGVGVALRPLTSKEQVGMTPDSHAVVCINGNLALCHDKLITPIMPLSDLPLAVTISVGRSMEGSLYMTYKVRVNGLTRSLQGRRFLALRAEGGDDQELTKEGRKRSGAGGGEGATSSIQSCDKSDTCLTERDDLGGRANSPGADDDGNSATPVKCSASLKNASSPFSVHPVFTVSQRVKMQFPHSSDV